MKTSKQEMIIPSRLHFDALVEALDQFVQNTSEAVEVEPNAKLHAMVLAASYMLDKLNAQRIAAVGGAT